MWSEADKTGAEPGDRRSMAVLVDEALGYVFSAALRAVAAVGVADKLAGGPRTVAELAAQTGVHEGSLHRVLRLVATRGVVEELDDGRFRLTELGQALRSDVPLSARPAVLMLTDHTLWLPSGEMERCLREGGSVFGGIFGMPFFDYVAQDEQTATAFHDGMASFSDAENRPIAAAYDFPELGVVVDVGGGQGLYFFVT
ncbi:SAM-dependent methyltransferase, partial [Nonomuraea zeae]